ncbi:AAA family ATPase [Capnocytophaga granulosa]|jgi:ATPase
MLESIKIKKLFGLFDYHITLDTTENITILTGPNGYGKTTILNIIYHFFNQQFFYFQKLNFESISFEFSENKRMELTKRKKKNKEDKNAKFPPFLSDHEIETVDINILLFDNGKEIDKFTYDNDLRRQIERKLKRFLPIRQLTDDLWYDERTEEPITFDKILNENKEQLPDNFFSFLKKQGDKKSNSIIDLLNISNIYLIKEQRLLRKIFNPNKEENTFVNTIELYAKGLRKLIEEKQLEAYKITQKLDSTFPKRLIETTTTIDEATFKERFTILKEKQNKLQQFGIAISQQEVTNYNPENAKVLSVYLNDSEEKLNVYDDLLEKIELFVNIINQREFAFKSIQISNNKGFSFYQNKTQQPLSLTDLSSGEQQEVVLLYELLFKTAPNSLILIDEPEISLHVIWQKAFIDDLKKIAKLKRISFLVSTHSPQIINNYWELTRDLFELSNAKENE